MTTITRARLRTLFRAWWRDPRTGAAATAPAAAGVSRSSCAAVADAEPVWEVARLVAELDPSIPDRLRAAHPATGRCRSCRTVAPCPPRRLADLAAALATRQVERHATRPDPPE